MQKKKTQEQRMSKNIKWGSDCHGAKVSAISQGVIPKCVWNFAKHLTMGSYIRTHTRSRQRIDNQGNLEMGLTVLHGQVVVLATLES